MEIRYVSQLFKRFNIDFSNNYEMAGSNDIDLYDIMILLHEQACQIFFGIRLIICGGSKLSATCLSPEANIKQVNI